MESVSDRQQPHHSLSKTLAATVGSMFAAFAIGIAMAAALPLRSDQRLLIGSYSVLPLWVATACCAFLAPSGRRAWLMMCAAAALAALIAFSALAFGANSWGGGA